MENLLNKLEELSKRIEKVEREISRARKNFPLYKRNNVLEEVPLFKTVANPGSPMWSNRVEEEFSIFKEWRKICILNNWPLLFRGLDSVPNNPRIFYCFYCPEDSAPVRLSLRLLHKYPKEPPIADRFGIGEFSEPETRNPCLGELKRRWRSNGRMGIAHYLVILGFYLTAVKHSVSV